MAGIIHISCNKSTVIALYVDINTRRCYHTVDIVRTIIMKSRAEPRRFHIDGCPMRASTKQGELYHDLHALSNIVCLAYCVPCHYDSTIIERTLQPAGFGEKGVG